MKLKEIIDGLNTPGAISPHWGRLAMEARKALRQCQREKREMWKALCPHCEHNEEGKCTIMNFMAASQRICPLLKGKVKK